MNAMHRFSLDVVKGESRSGNPYSAAVQTKDLFACLGERGSRELNNDMKRATGNNIGKSFGGVFNTGYLGKEVSPLGIQTGVKPYSWACFADYVAPDSQFGNPVYPQADLEATVVQRMIRFVENPANMKYKLIVRRLRVDVRFWNAYVAEFSGPLVGADEEGAMPSQAEWLTNA